jgi:hypothetical protein
MPLSDKKVVAVLESMWDWRQMTSGAGYQEAPRSFRINPQNYSGKRLYRLVGDADLHVTNACRELCASANHHGTPDPQWLCENLELLMPFDVLLVCGKIAQATYARTGLQFTGTIQIPHPAARMWTQAMIADVTAQVTEAALKEK